MRLRRFDLAIQLHGSSGPANDIVYSFGAFDYAGFLQPGEKRVGSFIPWPDHALEPARYLLLVQSIGIAPGCSRSLRDGLAEGEQPSPRALAQGG